MQRDYFEMALHGKELEVLSKKRPGDVVRSIRQPIMAIQHLPPKPGAANFDQCADE